MRDIIMVSSIQITIPQIAETTERDWIEDGSDVQVTTNEITPQELRYSIETVYISLSRILQL